MVYIILLCAIGLYHVCLGCFISNCPTVAKEREKKTNSYNLWESDLSCPTNMYGICYYPGLCCVQGEYATQLLSFSFIT